MTVACLAAIPVQAALAGGATAALRQDAAPAPETRSPEEVLSAQLVAFNAADVDGMVANVSEEFAWIAVDSDGAAVQLVGRAQFRRSMQAYFGTTPDPRAEIVGMVVSGDFVSAVERAFWTENGEQRSQDSLAVYEVRNGLIHRVWYFPAASAGEPSQAGAPRPAA